ncbi:MAG: hypothetical protein LQ340_006201 [Diploschistes diacapsis]|nr:MAG: hypothetical protein LQ340_006201 [Diploschistes diacapsis]
MPPSEVSDTNYTLPKTQNSCHSACPSDAESQVDYIDLVKAITPEALLQIATSVRGPQSSAVAISNRPLDGSYNIVYSVTFADGVKWAARIPKHGTVKKFGDSQVATMKYELEFLRMVRMKTSLPVPEVFHYDTSFDNALGAPFALCAWLEGQSVGHWWHCDDGPTPLHQRRFQILDSIATAMAKLSFFSNSSIGLPVTRLEHDRLEITDTQPLRGRDDERETRYVIDNRETIDAEDGDHVIYYEYGPFHSTAEYFRALLKNQVNEPVLTRQIGAKRMMMLIIDAIEIVEKKDSESQAFVIAHPDLDIQNILVHENGTLAGILDWDGICTKPKQLGYAAYPVFLARDFVPSEYYWFSPYEEAKAREDSPATLRELRRTYRSLLGNRIGAAAKFTTNSHLYRAVEKGCRQLSLTEDIIVKMVRTCIDEHVLEDPENDAAYKDSDVESGDKEIIDTNGPATESTTSEGDTPVVDTPATQHKSISQESIASTLSQDIANALAHLGSWLGMPFVTIGKYLKNVVKRKRKSPKEQQSLLEAAELVPASREIAPRNQNLHHIPDTYVGQANTEDFPNADEEAMDIEEEGSSSDETYLDDPEVPLDSPLPSIPPNENCPDYIFDLNEALGRDELGEDKLEMIRNRFVEVFSSDEICEEWDIPDEWNGKHYALAEED